MCPQRSYRNEYYRRALTMMREGEREGTSSLCPKMALSLQSSFPSLLNVGMTGMHHHDHLRVTHWWACFLMTEYIHFLYGVVLTFPSQTGHGAMSKPTTLSGGPSYSSVRLTSSSPPYFLTLWTQGSLHLSLHLRHTSLVFSLRHVGKDFPTFKIKHCQENF